MTQTANGISISPTEDGSLTLYNPTVGEHYHSVHGAMQESRHIFIEMGLHQRLKGKIDEGLHILEVGFGTGLNALLTLTERKAKDIPIHYTSLELYPITEDIYTQLSYTLPTTAHSDVLLQSLHQAKWDTPCTLPEYPNFTLDKRHIALQAYTAERAIDLIYFDAFSPDAQEELWSEDIFRKLYECSRQGAVLTTYCAKGEVRRRLQRAGWQVERLPGPPGKREMLRASKASQHNK